MLYLTVDGMLSGTGIGDAVEGGYVAPCDLGVSSELADRIAAWLTQSEDAHYHQFNDQRTVTALDAEVWVRDRVTETKPRH